MRRDGEEMKKGNNQYLILVLFIGVVFILIVAGCLEKMEKATVEPSALVIAPSAIETITKTSMSTLNPTLSATPTRTITPFPNNTRTPLPTLSSEEAQERVWKLMTGDEICLLPCWGNIVPGKTSIDKAKAYLNSFAYEVGVTSKGLTIWTKFLHPNQERSFQAG